MQTFGLTSLHITLPLLFETNYIACHNTYKNYVILITKFCNYEKPNTDSKRHTNLFAHSLPFNENIRSFQIFGSKRITNSKFITHYINLLALEFYI